MLNSIMEEKRSRPSADEVLTEALHRLFELYGPDLSDYFRELSITSSDHQAELPTFVDQRFANRR